VASAHWQNWRSSLAVGLHDRVKALLLGRGVHIGRRADRLDVARDIERLGVHRDSLLRCGEWMRYPTIRAS
jgi:hypothetical protein